MKISIPEKDFVNLEHIKQDLQDFLVQDEPSKSPPCPGCKKHLPHICGPTCSEASKSLSIDPDQYPIETSTIPLVFEINATRLLQTCWSCEGHMHSGEKQIWKIPQVCFYSKAAIYPKLISSYLGDLFLQKRLKYRWNISLTEISQSIYPTYSIRPDLTNEYEPSLGLMQNDLKTIGEDLHLRLKDEARKLLNTIP